VQVRAFALSPRGEPFALPAFSVITPTQDRRGSISDHGFSMVDRDAGVAPMDAHLVVVFR
jgi:hypothetical protein